VRIWANALAVVAVAVALGFCVPTRVKAADLTVPLAALPAPLTDIGNTWAARFGVFAHNLNGVEQGTVDLKGELATPRLFTWGNDVWQVAVPRLALGGNANLSGRTSFVYVDFLWTIPWSQRWFTEISVGPLVHDGSLRGTPTMTALGCRLLVHAGLSIGYRLTERLSAMLSYEHASNAEQISGCGNNQGLDNVGIKLSYAF
jgi:lipid A 3-O-deacylase